MKFPLFYMLLFNVGLGIITKVIKAHKNNSNILKNPSYMCKQYTQMMMRKTQAVVELAKLIKTIESRKEMNPKERKFHVKRLQLFQRELNDSEKFIVESIKWLSTVLSHDFQTLQNEKISTKIRLDMLHDATLKKEQDYKQLLLNEENLDKINRNRSTSSIQTILRDIGFAADKLEHSLDNHAFELAAKNPSLVNGGNIEAVIKLENDAGNAGSNESNAGDTDAIKLVDVYDNQFVLSKGRDSTVPHEDHHLIIDVVLSLLSCLIFGWICIMLHCPAMFGYIIAGVLIGPSGINILKSVVQVETLGEFGVFFILFKVGLEFSPTKIRKVLLISIFGTTSMMGILIIMGILIGYFLRVSLLSSAFIAACLALSSTPLNIKFLEQTESGFGPGDYGSVLMGILVMQDILLGILIAVLPSISVGSSSLVSTTELWKSSILLILRIHGCLFLTALVCLAISKLVLHRLFKHIIQLKSQEMLTMLSMSLAFVILLLTNSLGISMEVGCFMAGVMASSLSPELVSLLETTLCSVSDFFSSLFFMSIGLHIFPSFMAYEITYLTSFTLMTVSAKFLVGCLVLMCLLRKHKRSVVFIVSAGLAQVSEFSFVLGSRARRLGIISREVYLLILSVTTLSLIFAPILWKVVFWVTLRKSNSSKLTSTQVSDEDISTTESSNSLPLLIRSNCNRDQ